MIHSFQGEYRFLSNFYPSPIHIFGTTAATVEHAYQASKAYKGLEAMEVLVASGPGEAKRMGRKVTLRPDWEAAKLGVMRDLLRLKFARDSLLAQQLLATGDALLVEGNTWGDTFWGVVYGDPWPGGKGQNWLGHLLMARRAELRGQA